MVKSIVWRATATWWIPTLLVLGAWRQIYQRFPAVVGIRSGTDFTITS
jgi:hypothetical protein